MVEVLVTVLLVVLLVVLVVVGMVVVVLSKVPGILFRFIVAILVDAPQRLQNVTMEELSAGFTSDATTVFEQWRY